MLLVVMAVVLFLAAKNWKSVAPTALDIKNRNKNGHADRPPAPPPEEFDPTAATSDDAGAPAPPVRPSLGEMDKRTTDHTDAVQSALDQAQ